MCLVAGYQLLKSKLIDAATSLFSKRPQGGRRVTHTNGRLQFTSLGHLRKKTGTTTIMLQNVIQKTTSECRNTSRSPEERPQKKTRSSINVFCSIYEATVVSPLHKVFLPRGVKRIMEATRKPSINPTTMTQAMTEPNRHQLINTTTPPTTPITADRTRRTVDREKRRRLSHSRH